MQETTGFINFLELGMVAFGWYPTNKQPEMLHCGEPLLTSPAETAERVDFFLNHSTHIYSGENQESILFHPNSLLLSILTQLLQCNSGLPAKPKSSCLLKLLIQISSPELLVFGVAGSRVTPRKIHLQRHWKHHLSQGRNSLVNGDHSTPWSIHGGNCWQVLKVTFNVINSLGGFNALADGILIYQSTFNRG